jgi:nucleotide-binding universal stress UspA family protein
MKNILIAVDDTKSTRDIFSKCTQICKCMAPDNITLLFVEKFEGHSLMDQMLGDAELSTLKNVLEGTEYKAALDAKAEKVLGYYKGLLTESPPAPNVKTVVKSGNPAEEILKLSEEEGMDMILIGSRGQRGAGLLMMGSVSREVANLAKCPVMIVK